MHIQYNYANFKQSDALEDHAGKTIDHSIGRYADRITRVEVHLADESSTSKRTPKDQRCLIEARPAGMKPLSAEDRADDIYDAVKGASRKIERILEKRFAKA